MSTSYLTTLFTPVDRSKYPRYYDLCASANESALYPSLSHQKYISMLKESTPSMSDELIKEKIIERAIQLRLSIFNTVLLNPITIQNLYKEVFGVIPNPSLNYEKIATILCNYTLESSRRLPC